MKNDETITIKHLSLLKIKNMKKNIVFVMAATAMLFASCGGSKTKTAAEATDSTATADSTEQVDTTALAPETKSTLNALTAQASKAIEKKDPKQVTTALADLAATYKALVNAGKLADAKTYGAAIKKFVKDNEQTLKSVAADNTTIADLITNIENLPTTAATTADEAKKAVAQDVVNLASPYLQKGAAAAATAEAAAAVLKNAPAAAKAAIEAAPATAKAAAEQAANQAVNNAKTAADNKVNEEANKAASKANEAVTKAQNKAAEKVNKAASKANDAVNKAAGKALKGLGL